ncbi:dUTP diphosphatase [Lichenihabitans sp. Uapishka_5]|uniref:dUTP diphosphatase n=1 Tax=Lichenihabitans sp. Uapishka_5 TaxID=3037302 RepID=UPI0029E7F081|nr:dUTP diphosphatase [Lichenihabitans sp. Uapishka_5]MDX7950116.1 dUTP diphosphatase [Lichenihabitans sp. Uapishka_5]
MTPIPVLRLPHAEGLPLPAYQSPGAAGLDLVAALPASSTLVIEPGAFDSVPTGLCLALPPGWEAQVRPRSGLALHHGVTVLNAPGTIDSDYRGEIKVLLVNHGRAPFVITRGTRIAQLVLAHYEQGGWVEVPSLEATERGGGGFGSTGHAIDHEIAGTP